MSNLFDSFYYRKKYNKNNIFLDEIWIYLNNI